MAYTNVELLTSYLDVGSDTDNGLINRLISAAQIAINNKTKKVFEASADTTRRFTVGVHTAGRELFFDEDLCQITSVVTNADNGSGGTTIPSSSYVTMPRNETPYWGLRILSSADYVWEYTSDPENGITITGRWAYSLVAPDDIIQATTRLAGYYYKQKDAQIFDTTAIPDAGVIQIPQGFPSDVMDILERGGYMLKVQR